MAQITVSGQRFKRVLKNYRFLGAGIQQKVNLLFNFGNNWDYLMLVTEEEVWRRGGCYMDDKQGWAKVEELRGQNLVKLSAGSGFGMALTGNGRVFSWGVNSWKLGSEERENPESPQIIPGLPEIRDISCGLGFALVLTQSGSVYGWGINEYGQLGDGTTNNRRKPSIIKIPSKAKTISCSNQSSFAFTENGELYCWGRNYNFELGLGHQNKVHRPTLNPINGIKKLVTGLYDVLALNEEGFLFVWGYNSDGQLGLGHQNKQSTPEKLSEEVSDVICFGDYSSYKNMKGEIFIFGKFESKKRLEPELSSVSCFSQLNTGDGCTRPRLLIRDASEVVEKEAVPIEEEAQEPQEANEDGEEN